MTTEPNPNQVLYTVPTTTQAERDAMDAARPKTVSVLVFWKTLPDDRATRFTDIPTDLLVQFFQAVADDGTFSWVSGRDYHLIKGDEVRRFVVNDIPLDILDEQARAYLTARGKF